MRCDLHVHTAHSGMCSTPLLGRICRESYSAPGDVYDLLKRRGMELVTVTDHDSVGAAEKLRHFPDFFSSEEVSCESPSGTRLHAGVYDVTERQHVELQRRRSDLISLLAYLLEQRLFFSINHAFSGLTGRRSAADFAFFEDHFPAIETLNGQMLAACNRPAALLAARAEKVALAGSDGHTLSSIGTAFTEVRGARNKQEFLEGLRQGLGVVHGTSGNFGRLTLTVLEIGTSLMREKRWTLLLAPLMLAVPAVTLANCVREIGFAGKWARRVGVAAAEPNWLEQPNAEVTSA